MKTKIKVQVLHKCESGNTLAVGKTFRFRSGDAYTVQENGSVIKANPKSWTNKKERKAWLKQRREVAAA